MRANSLMLRAMSVILVACGAWSALTLAGPAPYDASQKSKAGASTRADGLAAWQQVYSVLTHPRCINCHTATNYPQQGDDRHRHFANVVRGPAGNGVPALQCVTCHQEANADSTGVPGAHDWHLAPLRDQTLGLRTGVDASFTYFRGNPSARVHTARDRDSQAG